MLAQSKKVAGVILIVSSRKNYIVSKTWKMLHHVQLSFIQLGGGIAVGVQAAREKYFSVLNTPDKVVFANISVGVWITTQVCSQSSNNNTPQIWTVGGALCDITIAVCMTYYVSSLSPSCFWREIKSHSRFTMAAFAIWSYNQSN